MKSSMKLNKSITLEEFDNGYWYAKEIKDFAKEIGIQPVSKLRKDELEKIIRHYIKTGKITQSKRQFQRKKGKKDSEIGLTVERPIKNYTNDRGTLDFIQKEASKIHPGLKRKSGVWYWLNRWREEQVEQGNNITYKDLIEEFIRLNLTEGRLPKITSARFNNFISDFLENEKNSTRKLAMQEWEKLKKLDIPKNYESWKKYNQSKKIKRY